MGERRQDPRACHSERSEESRPAAPECAIVAGIRARFLAALGMTQVRCACLIPSHAQRATERSGCKMKGPLSGPASRQPLRAVHLRSTALDIVWRAATEKSRESFRGRCPRTPSSAMTMKGGLTPSTSFLSRRRRRGLPYLSQEGCHDR